MLNGACLNSLTSTYVATMVQFFLDGLGKLCIPDSLDGVRMPEPEALLIPSSLSNRTDAALGIMPVKSLVTEPRLRAL
jgi:hypothetical protein